MTEVTTVDQEGHRILTAREELGPQLRELLALVPESNDEAELNIARAILGAPDADSLDSPWRGEGMRKYVDKVLTVRGIRAGESDYPNGLGIFLIVDVKVNESGEILTVTTGSTAIVLQLLKANALDAFPLQVIPKQAQSRRDPSRKPMHLEIPQ